MCYSSKLLSGWQILIVPVWCVHGLTHCCLATGAAVCSYVLSLFFIWIIWTVWQNFICLLLLFFSHISSACRRLETHSGKIITRTTELQPTDHFSDIFSFLLKTVLFFQFSNISLDFDLQCCGETCVVSAQQGKQCKGYYCWKPELSRINSKFWEKTRKCVW